MAFIDRLVIRLGRALAWGFVAIVAMMVYEVIARYGFNAPTIWAHELAGLLAAVAFIAGGAYCMADDSHMRITAFIETRGPGFKRVSHYLSLLAGGIYLAGLAYAAFNMTGDALFRFGLDGSWDPERSGSTWNTPLPAFIKLALFVGALLFLAMLVRRGLARGKGQP